MSQNQEEIKELSESAQNFITSLNNNVNRYDNSSDQRKIESFNFRIVQKIIDASNSGKRSIYVDSRDLYDYKSYKTYYKESTEDMGLKWSMRHAGGEVRITMYGSGVRASDSDLIEISFSSLS